MDAPLDTTAFAEWLRIDERLRRAIEKKEQSEHNSGQNGKTPPTPPPPAAPPSSPSPD
jgi:hypothetical protein